MHLCISPLNSFPKSIILCVVPEGFLRDGLVENLSSIQSQKQRPPSPSEWPLASGVLRCRAIQDGEKPAQSALRSNDDIGRDLVDKKPHAFCGWKVKSPVSGEDWGLDRLITCFSLPGLSACLLTVHSSISWNPINNSWQKIKSLWDIFASTESTVKKQIV